MSEPAPSTGRAVVRGTGIALAAVASVLAVVLVAYFAVVVVLGTALAGTGLASLVPFAVGAAVYVGYVCAAPFVFARVTRTGSAWAATAWLVAVAAGYAGPWWLLVATT